jgi:hypothetical protein
MTTCKIMIQIDCSEMTLDEQLALSSSISEGLQGRGVALVNGSKIVIDEIQGKVSASEVLTLVRGFVSKRKDAKYYSVDAEGERFTVHTPDPLARNRGNKVAGLPDNLLKCPHCSFVTPFQELYNVHLRSHYF